ncbi:MAG TPA: HAD family hydrolase [Kofleriaceae bacterium]|nr:HAD family hydrolase [Kofleriaceae bacterium]
MARLGVIFDVDGTLVNSNDAHAHAWVEAFTEADIPSSFARVRGLIGMGGDKLVAEVAGYDDDDPRISEIGDRRAEIFRERWLPTVRPLPGARALVERLRDRGVPIALATSARKDELEGVLDRLGMPDLAEVATSSDDADRSKPDPDIVVAAIERLGLPHDRIVMVGDTPYDLEAAHRAGIGLVAVRSGGFPDRSLEGALAIFDGPQDLLEHLDTSPLAPR